MRYQKGAITMKTKQIFLSNDGTFIQPQEIIEELQDAMTTREDREEAFRKLEKTINDFELQEDALYRAINPAGLDGEDLPETILIELKQIKGKGWTISRYNPKKSKAQ